MHIITYSDGGARGNPGPAAIGAVIYNQKKEKLAEISQYIGETTNNQAEYKALYHALLKAQELGAKQVTSYLDSELIVRQMQGIYKVKNADLKILFENIQGIIKHFDHIEFLHVKRELNKEADALVNQALDAEI